MGSSIIPSNTEAMAAGNVIFGGVIGLGVDAASGDKVVVEPTIGGCSATC